MKIYFVFLFFIVSFKATSQVKSEPIFDSMTVFLKMERFDKARPFAEKWQEKLKATDGVSSPQYDSLLNNLWDIYRNVGNAKLSESVLTELIALRKLKFGAESPELIKPYKYLGSVFLGMQQFDKAESMFLKALEIQTKTLGGDDPEVANTMFSLGGLYKFKREYLKAENLYIKGLEIKTKRLGENHIDVVKATINYADFIAWQNVQKSETNFKKAEGLYMKALEITLKTVGDRNPVIGRIYHNMGQLYRDVGMYSKAEFYLEKGLDLDVKILDPLDYNLGVSYSSVGLFFKEIGNYSKAESYLLKALVIRKTTTGILSHQTGAAYLNLGGLFFQMKDYSKAEYFHKKAYESWKGIKGEDHYDISLCYFNLALDHENAGLFKMAELELVKSLEIRKKVMGKDHPFLASSFSTLGDLYRNKGDYSNALSTYNLALEIARKNYNEESQTLINLYKNLGVYYQHRGLLQKAEGYFIKNNAFQLKALKRDFPAFSDNEKAKFFATQESDLEDFSSFCIERYTQNPFVIDILYNTKLATKALLLNSSTKWKRRIKNSNDEELLLKYGQWEDLQSKIGKLVQSTDSIAKKGLDTLIAKSEKLEKELSLISENFSSLIDKKQFTWQDVQKRLMPGEAAIEIVRVKKFGIRKTVTDTSDSNKIYLLKGLSDSILYAALIVKPNQKFPQVVLLQNGNTMEGKSFQLYMQSIQKQVRDELSYQTFWGKINKNLGPGIKRVFVSPDGVYNSINLNTLLNTKTGKYLLEEKEIRIVTNTKDLVSSSIPKPNEAYACLAGYPDFNLEKEKRHEIRLRQRTGPELPLKINTRGGQFTELPGTRMEIESISKVLQAKGWQVESFLGKEALEESIKETQRPRVLHIATHGFFQSDSGLVNDPMLSSGLLLTGANRTFSGERDELGDDGILTAYEAMNLNLDNTDLVVLSACETGLGEIKNGEGVYGLQRAFKVAGAKSIIMSLWKVDDDATQELMVAFYKNWLSAPNRNKRQAFLAAQKQLKAKYPNPYYWGAFVMVGE